MQAGRRWGQAGEEKGVKYIGLETFPILKPEIQIRFVIGKKIKSPAFLILWGESLRCFRNFGRI